MTSTAIPVSDLAADLREIWEQSVDELDASVSLEADGVNDLVAAHRYGVRDVAQLAEQLVAMVPARAAAIDPDETGPAIPHLRLAARGLLFAIPGLFYLTVSFANPTSHASVTMVAAMLTGWGLSQAVALVAYRVLGRHDGPSAARVLRRILAGALAVAAFALIAGMSAGQGWLTGLAAGQILYVIAATVLLFYSADRMLGLVLTPGGLVCTAFLAGVPIADPVAVAAVAATVLAACGAAWHRAGLDLGTTAPVGRALLSDLAASGPFVLQGLLSGVAVAYVPVRMLGGTGGADVHALDLSIVPLVLSMGFAEIELLRLRAAGGRLMRRTVTLGGYQRGALRLVVTAQLRFLSVLAASSALIGVVIVMTSGINSRDLTLLAAYAVLGAALLAALVLVAVDRVNVALAGFLVTGVLAAAGAGLDRLLELPTTVEGGYLAACFVLLACLTALAVRTLRDPRVLA